LPKHTSSTRFGSMLDFSLTICKEN
jgi:hypothetical protein